MTKKEKEKEKDRDKKDGGGGARHYVVGVDLGTTHCALAWAEADAEKPW